MNPVQTPPTRASLYQSDAPPAQPSRLRRSLPDVIGVIWVLGASISLIIPALVHGVHLGPYNVLYSPNHGLATVGHKPVRLWTNTDIIDQMVPWSALDWRMVHQGHIPLWNPFNALGTPLAFNWQSAPFSIPTLISYLFPLSSAFTAAVITSLLIAGPGAYLMGRSLRLNSLGSATIGTVFVLSGPFAAWLGYPFPAVYCWAGWIVACGIYILRGKHPAIATIGMAVTIAFALYGGQPEGIAVLFGAIILIFAIILIARAKAGGVDPVLAPSLRLIAAFVLGTGLAMPLVLPAVLLTASSIRNFAPPTQAFPTHQLAYLIFQGYDGLPITGNGGYGISLFYYVETVAYIGIGALALAGIGLWVRRKSAVSLALFAAILACLALVFVGPVDTTLDKLPLVGNVTWWRALMPLSLIIATLAGITIDVIVREKDSAKVVRWLGIAFGSGSAVVSLLWVFGRGGLQGTVLATRDASFRWQVVDLVVGVAAALFVLIAHRFTKRYRRGIHTAGAVLILLSITGFLLSAGAPLVQSSDHGFIQTSALTEYQDAVGNGVVASGVTGCALGIPTNDNDVYGVRQFDDYDASLPKTYFTDWPRLGGTSAGIKAYYLFCPAVKSAAIAREFGISFILEPGVAPGPPGVVLDRRIDGESLYRVPGVGAATVTALQGGRLPGDQAYGRPVRVDQSNPRVWRLSVTVRRASVVRFHLNDVVGWHATLNGRPLPLSRYAGLMMQAEVPAGSDHIILSYWPSSFTAGLVIGAVCLSALAIGLLVAYERRAIARGVRTDGLGSVL